MYRLNPCEKYKLKKLEKELKRWKNMKLTSSKSDQKKYPTLANEQQIHYNNMVRWYEEEIRKLKTHGCLC